MSPPLTVHPDNPKLFLFRGRPLALITATEHYGAVMNRPFRFERYLADAAAHHITLTRLFMLFRELQTPANPYSTCKPESPDYVAPFADTGPGTRLDGQPKVDLDRWNPEFFERLHRFLGLASEYGIVVEVTLLSNTYAPNIWALNPLHPDNNINHMPEIEWPEYLTIRHPGLFARQAAHVRKIVEETNGYDNLLYEICNEPGGAHPGKPGYPKQEEVDEWQLAVGQVIREADSDPPHLIAWQEAFSYSPWEQPSDRSFAAPGVDVVNMHPLPNTSYRGTGYDMGAFMAKELKLRALRDFCLATYAEPKPLNFDEDNAATQYKEPDGWTIHRKRAWVTLLSGAHYDMIDFSIINYCETGTEASRSQIRRWMRHLSEFVHSLDLARCRPLPRLVKERPEYAIEAAFGTEGEDYAIYLADERELSDAGAGAPLLGSLLLDLPEGSFRAACYSPVTGLYSPATPLRGGRETRVDLPEFRQDLALRVTRT